MKNVYPHKYRLGFALVPFTFVQAAAQPTERPNILWLTIEDTSDYEFGCYGNRQVQTPNIDSLARNGIQYMNMWSVAPQSSPARSSIITGCYATSYAMDFHRNKQKTPPHIFFPELLRAAGYFCTNNYKTDYNTSNDHSECWDECGKKATYNSPARKKGQPFFSVFNCHATHMGRIRSFHTEGRRDFTKEGIYPDQLILPPHLPDLPEIRSDYACHLEGVQDIDKWVGYFLSDLKDKNLTDNTIIFFYSDHGGCSPRGKGYLNETGLRVPFIVYFPQKWQHLSSKGIKIKEGRLVNFTDLGPTVLSLAGIDSKDQFQGKPFLGKYDVPEREYQFAFTSNQHHNYMPVRAVTDGRYKYMRVYIPYKHASLRNYYQWGMPGNQAWDKLILSGQCTDSILRQPYQHRRGEVLYDILADPFEIHDLSQDPRYQEKLKELRTELSRHIRTTKDLGFMSPAMRGSNTDLYAKARNGNYPIDELYDLVEIASTPTVRDINILNEYLSHSEADFRFWACVGLAELASTGQLRECPPSLPDIINDPDDYVAAEGCFALVHLNHKRKEALKRLVTPLNESFRKAGYSLLECLAFNTETRPYLSECIPALKQSAEKINIKDNEDPGMISRGILVNTGILNISDIYGEEGYRLGLSINRGRRALIPLPE